MKTYAVTGLDGVYLSACAVVTAQDMGHAKRLIRTKCASAGIPQLDSDLDRATFVIVDPEIANVIILDDGDY